MKSFVKPLLAERIIIKETEPADLQDVQLAVPAVANLETLGIIACLLLMLLAAGYTIFNAAEYPVSPKEPPRAAGLALLCLCKTQISAFCAGLQSSGKTNCKLLFKYFPSKLMLFGLLMLFVISSFDAKGVYLVACTACKLHLGILVLNTFVEYCEVSNTCSDVPKVIRLVSKMMCVFSEDITTEVLFPLRLPESKNHLVHEWTASNKLKENEAIEGSGSEEDKLVSPISLPKVSASVVGTVPSRELF